MKDLGLKGPVAFQRQETKKMKLKGKIFYPAKLPFKYEGMIKTCPQANSLRRFCHTKTPRKMASDIVL